MRGVAADSSPAAALPAPLAHGGAPWRRPAPGPGPAPRRRSRRPPSSLLRPARRDHPDRQPPPTRPLRTTTTRPAPGRRSRDRYLAHVARRGLLQLTDNPAEAKQHLIEDWWQAAEHDPCGTITLAYRREDLPDLNQAARVLMLAAGCLADERLRVDEREFRVGERVICRRNDARLGVRNGTRATVVGLDATELRLRTDTGAFRSINASYATEHLEHGYTLTGHAAQGARIRLRPGSRSPSGMGIRGPLPPPSGDPPLRLRRAVRTGIPQPRTRRPRPRGARRARTHHPSIRAARRRSPPTPARLDRTVVRPAARTS